MLFIHLGGDTMIRTSDLIAIFDIETERNSKITKQFIETASKNKKNIVVGEEEMKSFIITEDHIYYSPISSTTLKKRAKLI
jgi:hypothetical protein